MTRASPLGRLMRARREALGLSLRDLARESGLSPAWVSNIELGRRGVPEATVYLLLDTLHVSPESHAAWYAAAGVLPESLTEALLAHPERWGAVREVLK